MVGYDIKVDLKENVFENEKWVCVTQDRCCEHNSESACS